MKKAIQTLSFATLLAVSTASNAAIIEVKYKGIIDFIASNDSGSYSLGDMISGSLFINSNKAPGEYYSSSGTSPLLPGEAEYQNAAVVYGNDGDFVTGFAPSSSNSFDYVYLRDDHASVGGGDDFVVADDEFGESVDSNGDIVGYVDYLYLGLAAPIALDFITGSSLEQVFSLTDLDALLVGNLYKDSFKYQVDANGDQLLDTNGDLVYVYHNVDHVYVSLTNLSASVVPEPGALALFGLGLAGLIATRRRITATAA